MLRTHTCGELRSSDTGKEVSLCGWINSSRNHGQLIFLDLRDRYGLTQVVFDASTEKEAYDTVSKLRRESVICVSGTVDSRKDGFVNNNMPTGDIEVKVSSVDVLNAADPLPIETSDENTTEEVRAKYRYLDLRRDFLKNNLIIRHKVATISRNYLADNGFLEIETPLLAKSTPEGARDYLVPSRVNKGKFYALPQSPQLFKQMLMISGFDRYFQLARCLRDEDLRADRQPEFTQVDIEMSFIEEKDIQDLVEGLIKKVWKEVLGKDIETPFPRMTYHDAMSKYGSDRPDTRFDMLHVELNDIVKGSGFGVFDDAVKNGGLVKGMCVKDAGFSRKQMDKFTEFVKIYHAKGLVWLRMGDEGLKGSVTKFMKPDILKSIAERLDAKKDDIVMIIADSNPKIVHDSLGALRLEVGKKMGLLDPNDHNFLWVIEFPLLEFNEEEDRWEACHHPFTSPLMEDMPLVETEPHKARARAYDVVLNGIEIAGGSIRIHDPNIQKKVFKAIGLDDKTAQSKFGFFLEAFRYGAPPHGGIAFGFDRFVTLITGNESIRDVIAFPKTKSAECLMTGAPSSVADLQLGDLHIKLR